MISCYVPFIVRGNFSLKIVIIV